MMGVFKKVNLSAFCLMAMVAHAKTYHVSSQHIAGVNDSLQFRTISQATSCICAGDTIIIHGGIYREKVEIKVSGTANQPICILNAPGQKVDIMGSDVLKAWTKVKSSTDANIYVTDWEPLTKTDNRSHYPQNDFHKLIGRREQVRIMGIPLKQVLSFDKMERGTFFADDQNGKLYFQSGSNADMMKDSAARAEFNVEVSKRALIWSNKGAYIQLRGLCFSQAANHAQQGALVVEGNNNLIEYCVFEENNSVGALFKAENTVIRHCTFQNNAQLGFSAWAAHNSVMSDCIVHNNGWKGYSLDWEAGGNKIIFSRKFIIERCLITNNRGNGIWYDCGNEEGEVRNCLIMNNQNGGIFYEISFTFYAHDNIIIYNGLNSTFNAWGISGGISLSSSNNCLIERNILLGNKEGFLLREQKRQTCTIEQWKAGIDVWDPKNEKPIWNQGHIIRNNIIAYNRDAQIWGWFSALDGRQLPADKKGNITLGTDGHPVGLNLQNLELTFENNIYCTDNGNFPFFRWGVNWDDKRLVFNNLMELNNALGFEKEGKDVAFPFKNILELDFRVGEGLARSNSYPRGEIPSVKLGSNHTLQKNN